jgi:hypothetical protein
VQGLAGGGVRFEGVHLNLHCIGQAHVVGAVSWDGHGCSGHGSSAQMNSDQLRSAQLLASSALLSGSFWFFQIKS